MAALLLPCIWMLASGCGNFHTKPSEETVYVEQKDAYLRDHVAAVSNRTGHVENGDKLVVLEHGRRFVRVRDEKNEVGWIEERYVVPQSVYDGFEQLHDQAISYPVVVTATVRDDVAMHLAPGRDTPHLFMLKEGDKVQLMKRASTAKPVPAGALPLKNASPPPPLPASNRPRPLEKGRKKRMGPAPVPGAPAVPMEDWWLARDARNRVGWILGRRFDVDVPDTIAGYAENQRFVAVYTVEMVNDPESDLPDHQVPVYLALLAPYRDGLPYDYSTARVFSWNTKKHRYETAFRERDLWGYLPAIIAKDFFREGALPTFTLRVSATEDVTIDAKTGMPNPGPLVNKEYRMNGEVVQRVGPVQANADAAPKQSQTAAAAPSARRARHRRKR